MKPLSPDISSGPRCEFFAIEIATIRIFEFRYESVLPNELC